MKTLSWKCLTNLAACFVYAALLAGCDAVQHRSAASIGEVAVQEKVEIAMPGMNLSETGLDDVEMRHFAAYRSYVAVAGASSVGDDPGSNPDALRRLSEDLQSSGAAHLGCATRIGM
ncbi:hypothetical protein [Noviherbaspirillum sp.]|uniref:hypothetical protein n=1 Tax=Noviherbaspirillum sp. TaxID=1926288 RepID=UPI002FDFA028